jgi:hypothetical protein
MGRNCAGPIVEIVREISSRRQIEAVRKPMLSAHLLARIKAD